MKNIPNIHKLIKQTHQLKLTSSVDTSRKSFQAILKISVDSLSKRRTLRFTDKPCIERILWKYETSQVTIGNIPNMHNPTEMRHLWSHAKSARKDNDRIYEGVVTASCR